MNDRSKRSINQRQMLFMHIRAKGSKPKTYVYGKNRLQIHLNDQTFSLNSILIKYFISSFIFVTFSTNELRRLGHTELQYKYMTMNLFEMDNLFM